MLVFSVPLNKKQLEAVRKSSPLSPDIVKHLRSQCKGFIPPSKKRSPTLIRLDDDLPSRETSRKKQDDEKESEKIRKTPEKTPKTPKTPKKDEKKALEKSSVKDDKKPLEKSPEKLKSNVESFEWYLLDCCKEMQLSFMQSTHLVDLAIRFLQNESQSSQSKLEQFSWAILFACKEQSLDIDIAMELNKLVRSKFDR